MSFADFLEVMHQHSKVENLPDEVIAAFKASDPRNKGTIPARQLRHLLQNWGEGLSVREVWIFSSKRWISRGLAFNWFLG